MSVILVFISGMSDKKDEKISCKKVESDTFHLLLIPSIVTSTMCVSVCVRGHVHVSHPRDFVSLVIFTDVDQFLCH